MKKMMGILLSLAMSQAFAQFGPKPQSFPQHPPYSPAQDLLYDTTKRLVPAPGYGPQAIDHINFTHKVIEGLRGRLQNCEANSNKPNPNPGVFHLTQELVKCRAENERINNDILRLQNQSSELQTQVTRLQTVNQSLEFEKTQLLEQLRDLEGTDVNQWVCASACSLDQFGNSTNGKSVRLGYGQTDQQARIESIKNVRIDYTCPVNGPQGVHTISCEKSRTSLKGVYCKAACTGPGFNPNTNTLNRTMGAVGMNSVEALGLAMKLTQDNLKCLHGVKQVGECEVVPLN
jgi:hypothetical protein